LLLSQDESRGDQNTPPRYNSEPAAFPFLGRRTSSPPQFGQTDLIASLHSRQNVHS
jgi:hypothetical protein